MRRLPHRRIGFDRLKQPHHHRLNAFERLGGLPLEAQHQHGGGVGGANEAKAVGPVDAQAVNRVDGGLVCKVGRARLQLGNDLVGLAFGAGHVELGRAVAGGQLVEHLAGVGVAAQNFEQTGTRVGAVVKAKPALFKEDVAAHFTTQGRVNLFHFGLNKRVAGFEHERHATSGFNGRGQALRALDVEHNGAAGHAREHVLRKEQHLPVGEDVMARWGDDAQAIAIAIKRKP
jgi:hypothetical protein